MLMKHTIIAIVQARMGSSRLPGKSLEKIGNWSLIELVMKRVNQSSRIEETILATSNNPKDNVLANHVNQLGFQIARGSEKDVLSRFYDAAKPFQPTIVVRITGDCPLISPKLIDHAIDNFLTSVDPRVTRTILFECNSTIFGVTMQIETYVSLFISKGIF